MTNPPAKKTAAPAKKTAAPAKKTGGDVAPVMLVNALRDRSDVYVESGGSLLRLPRVPAPTLLSGVGSERESVSVAVPADAADPASGLRAVRLGAYAGDGVPLAALGVPPRLDGVLYLVDPLTRLQFPHRDDFVMPGAYSLRVSGKAAKALRGKGKKSKKKTRRAMSRLVRGRMFPLVSIDTGPVRIAGPDTPTIGDDD